MPDRQAISRQDVAEYILDMSGQLADLARGSGLHQVAADLDKARRGASAALRALHSAEGNAAPEDAA